jgi:hypothetical protein
MLRPDVAQAVEAGRFHIHAIDTVEEGIELLTSTPAGSPDAEGNYPQGTVYGAVQRRLNAFREEMRPFERP